MGIDDRGNRIRRVVEPVDELETERRTRANNRKAAAAIVTGSPQSVTYPKGTMIFFRCSFVYSKMERFGKPSTALRGSCILPGQTWMVNLAHPIGIG